MSTSKINRTLKMTDGDNEAVMQELVREIEFKFQYGTAAPTSATVGNVYFQIGSSASTTVKTYIKVGSTWYGG